MELLMEILRAHFFTQPAITCSKLIETLEQGVKYVQSYLLLTLNIFHYLLYCFCCWLWLGKSRLGSTYLAYFRELGEKGGGVIVPSHISFMCTICTISFSSFALETSNLKFALLFLLICDFTLPWLKDKIHLMLSYCCLV